MGAKHGMAKTCGAKKRTEKSAAAHNTGDGMLYKTNHRYAATENPHKTGHAGREKPILLRNQATEKRKNRNTRNTA